VRFAPSPTGLLHLGNVRTALFNFLLARARGGSFLLRIEDTDAVRGHERYAEALMRDLLWLGLQWDEGPGPGELAGSYYQSHRGDLYAGYFEQLVSTGAAYRCFCSEHELEIHRKTQLAAGRPPRYSGRCHRLRPEEVQQRLAEGRPATLRFHVADGGQVEFVDGVRGPQRFATGDIGDFVIRRSDGSPAFFFSNAIDDALMGVTLVLRGEDHLTNTPRQILLLQALRLAVPEYAHMALVVGAGGAPLSKRNGSRSVEDLRAEGFLPVAINNHLARLGHTYASNKLLSVAELCAGFNVTQLHRSPAHHDEAQLLHWQREAVRVADTEMLVFWITNGRPVFEWVASTTGVRPPFIDIHGFVETVRANITFPRDAQHWLKVVFSDSLKLGAPAREVVRSAGVDFFVSARRAIEQHGTDFKALSLMVRQETGLQGKALFQPLRAALTGELDGPEMAKLLPLIGAERAQRRLTTPL